MKVKITKMPVRIKDKRYEIGEVLDVTEKVYNTIKSICIVYEEPKSKGTTAKKEEGKKADNTKKEKLTKEEIMIKLSEKGISFDPAQKVSELEKLLRNA